MLEQTRTMDMALSHYWEVIINYSVKIASALLVLTIGILVIRFLKSLVRKIFERRQIDGTITSFLLSMLTWVLRIILFIAVISKLGIETTSFVAVLGTMGLAVGLSLQGSLSNFTGGLLIILFKPFRLGDYIQAQGQEGTVRSIQIFNTEIVNDNNQVIYIPNGILSNGTVVNFSKENSRRANLRLTISANNNLDKVIELLKDEIKTNERVLEKPEPSVTVVELNNDIAVLSVKFWSLRPHHSSNISKVLIGLKNTIESHKINLPTQSVHIINKE